MAVRRWLLPVFTGMVSAALLAAGCGKEFREAAGPALESGVNSIAMGLIDGAFAAFEPDASNSESSP